MPLLPSPSPLPEGAREKIAALANNVALDLAALASIARKAHVNVRGENFGDLHSLFGKIYETADGHADTLAEFCAMLGVPAKLDAFDVVDGATKGIGPMPSSPDCETICRVLSEGVRTMLGEASGAATEIAKLGSRDGEQILIDVSIAFHKLGWMLLAHMHEEPMSRREPGAQEQESMNGRPSSAGSIPGAGA